MRRRTVLILAGIALAAAGVAAAFANDLAAARARTEGRSVLAETSFGALEYASLGAGEPVLAIHGAAGGFDQGLDMTGVLATRGYRVIAPSRFGYLRSATPRNLTTAMQADAYVELLDRLGIGKVTVVAISAGAWSALQFAIRHPDRCHALVLIVPADDLPEGVAIRGGAVTQAIVSSDFVAWSAIKAMPLMPGALSGTLLGTDAGVVRAATPGEKARVRQILGSLLPVEPRAAGMAFDVATAGARAPLPLERIDCPVLTVSAEDDAFGTNVRARQIAGAVPNGRAIVYPTGGHAMVGHFDDALREATDFMSNLPPEA